MDPAYTVHTPHCHLTTTVHYLAYLRTALDLLTFPQATIQAFKMALKRLQRISLSHILRVEISSLPMN